MGSLDLSCLQRQQKQASKEINLRNDDHSAVHCMVQYFYTLVYPNVDDVVDPARTAFASEEPICSILRATTAVTASGSVSPTWCCLRSLATEDGVIK